MGYYWIALIFISLLYVVNGAFVGVTYIVGGTLSGSVPLNNPAAPTGSTIIVAMTTTSNAVSVTDAENNVYVEVVPLTLWENFDKVVVFVATRVRRGVSSVSFTSDAPVTGFISVYDSIATIDAISINKGESAGAISTTPPQTTTCSNDLLYLVGFSIGEFIMDPIFVRRDGSMDGHQAGDRTVSSIGSYTGFGTNSPTNFWVLVLISFQLSSCVKSSNCPLGAPMCACSLSHCAITSSVTVGGALTMATNFTLHVQGNITLLSSASTDVSLFSQQPLPQPLLAVDGTAQVDGSLTIRVGGVIPPRFTLLNASSFLGSFRSINVISSDPCIVVQSRPEPSSSGLAVTLVVAPSGSTHTSCQNKLSLGVILGISFGAIVVAVVIIIVLVLLTKRARKNRTKVLRQDIIKEYASQYQRME